ncbi:MAG: peptidylprolyl isomerase [Bacteroidetes bacterium]|nr:peptidylprolyl isomerase [Bacteroidota bacterium]MDA0888689.1 peptidylprolyl isomerase [Bacteroidota bacterium]MDA1084536.1 peptidylprolyl isomerase [Bacteroidota bacterium]
MAILSKIRERSIFLIFIIGMALLAFVFTGVFDGSSSTSQDPVLIVGEEEVGIDEFSRQVDFAERNYRMTTMQAVNFAFNQSTNAKAFEQTFEALGLFVGKTHIEQFIENDPNFSSDPQFQGEDGSFDPNRFTDFILDLSQNNPQGFEQWKAQEASIKNNIRVQQYVDMVSAGLNTTNFEAQQSYALQNDLIDLEYVRVPYSVIPDSLVTVSNKDVERYIAENADTYEREESRSLQYVQFAETATPEDKVLIENQLRELLTTRVEFNEVSKQEETFPSFKDIAADALPNFVNENSDVPFQDAFLSETELSGSYANTLFNLPLDQVFGPYEDNGFTNISRIVSRLKQGKAKARHILIAYNGASRAAETVTRNKEAAKKEAYALLRKVKRGGDFAQLARENSDGPSASRGGELPEFVREEMVAPFSDFVFGNRTGAFGVAETEFGFHVIEIQDKKDVIKLATISKKLIPSEATSNQVFTDATQFELDIQVADFKAIATQNNYAVKDINGVKALDESLPVLGTQRQVVRWAFEEGRQVTDVKRFALSTGGYVIIQIKDVKEAGLPDVDELKATVTPLVIKEKKKAMLLKQISGYDSLEDVATKFEQTVSTANAVNRFTSMLAGVSNEPEVVGVGFGMAEGVVSQPIGGKSGVFVVQVKAKTAAEDLSNYAGYKASISNTAKQNIQTNVSDALKSNFEVTDNRNQYY